MHLCTPFNRFTPKTQYTYTQRLTYSHTAYHGYNKNIIPD